MQIDIMQLFYKHKAPLLIYARFGVLGNVTGCSIQYLTIQTEEKQRCPANITKNAIKMWNK